MLKIIRGLLIIFGLFVLSLSVLIASYFLRFAQSARVSPVSFIRSAIDGWQMKARTGRVTILLLGFDERMDQFAQTLLSDAMIFGSMDFSSGTLTLIPMPRDIWIAELKTKINALYYYGTTQKPKGQALAYANGYISSIIGQKIDYTFAITYSDLPALIDMVGGIDVVVERSFTDTEFPNPAYIASESGASPYMTVSFAAGRQHMDGATALQFIRSRHSLDDKEGSDIARSKRQLLVFGALLGALKNKQVVRDPALVGTLYLFWKTHVETNARDADIMSLGMSLGLKKGILLSTKNIPTDGEIDPPILVHPSERKYGTWVWEPPDGDWKGLQEFIANAVK